MLVVRLLAPARPRVRVRAGRFEGRYTFDERDADVYDGDERLPGHFRFRRHRGGLLGGVADDERLRVGRPAPAGRVAGGMPRGPINTQTGREGLFTTSRSPFEI